LRNTVWTNEKINAIIDSLVNLLDESKTRNFQKWQVIGQYVWPNYYVGQSYEDEINYLKNWLNGRLIWMDYQLVTSVEDNQVIDENSNFVLYQNFPNPFNPVTKIKYSLKKSNHVSIKLFDILGNEIATLVNDFKSPGEYSFELNAAKLGLSSGMYLYQMRSGEFCSMKKMIYLK